MKETKFDGNYNIVWDILNVIACIAVVILHVNGGFFGFANSLWWKFSVIIDTIFYWAVPIFFMLTGTTLIDYKTRYDTKTFLKKRFDKTVVPFLFWSIIAIPMALSGYTDVILDASSVSSFLGIINTIINHRAVSIYWFFIPLFAIYLCIPALGAIPTAKRKSIYGALILYSFVSQAILPTICHIIGIDYNYSIQNPLNGGGYIMYVLLGYYIANYEIALKYRVCIYISCVISVIFRIQYTILQSIQNGYIDYTFSGYINFTSVLMAVTIFLLFYNHDWSKIGDRFKFAISKLSRSSFGIYLIHMYILRFLVVCFDIPMQSFKWSFWGVPIVYILSFLLVSLGKRIPVIRKSIP